MCIVPIDFSVSLARCINWNHWVSEDVHSSNYIKDRNQSSLLCVWLRVLYPIVEFRMCWLKGPEAYMTQELSLVIYS